MAPLKINTERVEALFHLLGNSTLHIISYLSEQYMTNSNPISSAGFIILNLKSKACQVLRNSPLTTKDLLHLKIMNCLPWDLSLNKFMLMKYTQIE